MPTLYLLDTNTVSYIIRGHPPNARRHLSSIPVNQLAISVITEAELRYGVAKKPEAKNSKLVVEEFLQRVAILPWDSEAAHHYAELRAMTERTGRSLGNLDLLIAAHALAVGAILVTHDASLRRVRQLRTEDWTAN